MGRPEAARRLIVNADDFGRSQSINQAVIQAHRDGILTTASLMVNEPWAAEAVGLARENPRLGVGLHLSLLCGRAGLPPERLGGLVDSAGNFANQPAATGLRYFLDRSLREPLRAEIREQLRRFRATGLPLDHVNGHLHMHLHPVVLKLLLAETREWGITRMRFTRDPFWLNASLASGLWGYRASHAIIYLCLSAWAKPALRRLGIRHTRRVFGLLQNARVDETYAARLLPRLPAGDSELYSHPSLDEFKGEYEALVSPRTRGLVRELGIQLIRYQDL